MLDIRFCSWGVKYSDVDSWGLCRLLPQGSMATGGTVPYSLLQVSIAVFNFISPFRLLLAYSLLLISVQEPVSHARKGMCLVVVGLWFSYSTGLKATEDLQLLRRRAKHQGQTPS